MSDFFGGLSGIRYTDARINGDGPLPTTLSGPEGINGDADGRYNFNDSLLSGITPYAGPKGGRMGSDRNYQQIPHRKQFVVPPVFLPEPDAFLDQTFMMSHGIDMGDIAFILNVRHKRFLLTPAPYAFVPQDEDDSMPNYNIFCNICTVNYLLAGLHNYLINMADRGHQHIDKGHAWGRLLMCFDAEKKANIILKEANPSKFEVTTLRCHLLLQEIVRLKIIPLGICAMSEKQGGQHEVGLKPVQAAASFFTTLTVDGQNRDLVNIWRSIDISAGDFLILRLDFMSEEKNGPIKRPYTLNHYYKETIMKTLVMHENAKGVFQLLPDVLSFSYTRQDDLYSKALETLVGADVYMKSMINCALDYRQVGYWHIGQTYTKKLSFSGPRAPTNDNEMMQGQLLQINFAPVWKGKIEGIIDEDKIDLQNYKFLLPFSLHNTFFDNDSGGHAHGGHKGRPTGPVKPVGAPVGKPVGAPVGKPVGAPVGKPVGAPVGKPVGEPHGEPVDKSKVKPSENEVHDEIFEGVIEHQNQQQKHKKTRIQKEAAGPVEPPKTQFDIDLENIYQGFNELKSKQPVQDKSAKAANGAAAV
jgi:hypothetical protein